MGRLYYYGEASDRVEPLEDEYEITIECPQCGTELHEGDKVYQVIRRKGKAFPTYEIFACENCIDDLCVYVEDL